jgi:hypothetical protein
MRTNGFDALGMLCNASQCFNNHEQCSRIPSGALQSLAHRPAEVKCPAVVDRTSWLTDEEYSRPTMEQRFHVEQARGVQRAVARGSAL